MKNTTISLNEIETKLIRVLASYAKANNAWDSEIDVKKACQKYGRSYEDYNEYDDIWKDYYANYTLALWDYGLIELKREVPVLDPRLLVTFTERGKDFVNIVERTHDI